MIKNGINEEIPAPNKEMVESNYILYNINNNL